MSTINNKQGNNSWQTMIAADRNKDNSTLEYLLLEIQPIIHYLAQFIRLIQWKDADYKNSLLLLTIWLTWWSAHKYILFFLPMVPLLAIAIKMNYHQYQPLSSLIITEPNKHRLKLPQQLNKNSKSTTTTTMNLSMIKEDLIEIRNAFRLFSLTRNCVIQEEHKSSILLSSNNTHIKHPSILTVKQGSNIYFGMACLFIITYTCWAILLHQQIIQGCASIFWFIVLMVMCLCSPWATLILMATTDLIKFFNVDKEKALINHDNKSSSIQKQEEPATHTYCFELYHHQRWWFPTGWSNTLLPQDRPVWSDIYQESAPSIYKFRLPPTTYIGKPDKMNQQKIVSWIWIDPYWSIKQESNKLNDGDGWQYGTWKWKSWGSQLNTGLSLCVRRRKWVRNAQRIESWIQIKKTDHSTRQENEEDDDTKSIGCCSSLIGGSDTTASSLSSFSSIYDSEEQ